METEYTLRGYYRPSFFSLFINGEFNTDLNEMNKIDLGTFVHEYIHYLQNITTIFGLQNSSFYFTYLYQVKKHIAANNAIKVPINDVEHSDNILKSKIRFRLCNGSYEAVDIKYDHVELRLQENTENEITVKNVMLHFFLEKKEIKSIVFGNYCIKEGMAHLYQKIFDEDVEAMALPYKSVEIICRLISPELLKDKRKLISLCLVALNSQNSGLTFYELLLATKGETELSGIELYKKYLNELKVITPNDELSIKDYLLKSLEKFKNQLSASIYSELRHFELLVQNISLAAEKDSLPLVEILYEEELDNIEKLKLIIDFYGIPHIRTNDGFNVYPVDSETGQPSMEFVELIGLRIVLDRLLGVNDDKLNGICSWLPQCQHSEELVEESCYGEQWLRDKDCPFKIISDNWQLKEKITAGNILDMP